MTAGNQGPWKYITSLGPANRRARQVGVTQDDFLEGQIRVRGRAGQSLSLGKGQVPPTFCFRQVF